MPNEYDEVVRSPEFNRRLREIEKQKRETDRKFMEAAEARAKDLYPELKTARKN